jgi:hypothetical protein
MIMNIKDKLIDFDCALRDNETDLETLKRLFEGLKKEYLLEDIEQAYNEVIRRDIYEV